MAQAAREARSSAAAEHGPETGSEDRPAEGSRPAALAMTFDELLGSDDASSETADDIIRAVRAWRDTPDKNRRA